LIEEIKFTLLGYIHELEEAKKNVSTIVHLNTSDIETKISSLNDLLHAVSQIESKTNSIKLMSNLVPKEVASQYEEEIQIAKNQIEQSLNETRKLVSSEVTNLNASTEKINSLQTGIDDVKQYIGEKHSYFSTQSPVSEDDEDEGAIELEPIKVLCSEIESWTLSIESLKSQVMSLKTKPCNFEYEHLMKEVGNIVKDHQSLLEEAQCFLKTKTEYYERLKKIDDLCELCNIWLETKSKETLNLIQHHSLKSNGLTTQIAQLQRIFNDIKEHEDDTVLKSKELAKLNTHIIESEDLDELKEAFVNLKEIVLKNIRSLNEVFEERKCFEKSLDHCVDWIKNAESIVFCDIPDTGHIETLHKHLERFSELMREKEGIQETLTALSLQSQKILPTLNTSDQITLRSNLEFHLNQVDELSTRCTKKITDVSNKIKTIQDTLETSSEYDSRIKSIKGKLNELKKPIDVNNGGLEHTLGMYKKLSEELSSLKVESHENQGRDTSQRHSSKQEDVISIVENQITQTTELINIQEQYKGAITTITEEISNISTELENAKHTSEEDEDGSDTD
jgi:hypothetical protein